MGYQQIRAECECGYKVEKIEFGSTMIMLEVKNIDYSPAYCTTCGELNGVNILAKPIACSKCFSNDIKVYGTPEMTGKIIEPDVTSKCFFRGFELWNETLEMMAKDNNENFVPMTIDEYREDLIRRHNEKKDEYRTPIFRNYNLCPNCENYSLRFYMPWAGLHLD